MKRFLIFSLAIATPASAQRPGTDPHGYLATSGTIVVGLVADLGRPGAKATILRRLSGPTNVVLVSPEATPRDFALAMIGLNQSRLRDGDTLHAEMRAWIDSDTRAAEPSAAALAAAQRHLTQLKAATPMQVSGFGEMPALILDGRIARKRMTQ